MGLCEMADDGQLPAVADGQPIIQSVALDKSAQAVVIQPQAPQAEDVAPVGPEPGAMLLAVTRIINDNNELLEKRWENRQAEFLDRIVDQQRMRMDVSRPESEAGTKERKPIKREGEKTPDSPVSMAQMMTYYGTDSWLEYEAHFEEYCGRDDARKARYLCLHLREAAQTVQVGLTAEQKGEYCQVVDALKRYFCPK